MITLSHISKRFDEKEVLRDVSLQISPGITCLMGASGIGKTTLLRILTDLEAPDCGKISGVPQRIAMVFQEDRLTESLTVRGNLKLALGKHYDEQKAREMLSRLLLPDILSQTVSSLSGGMKRRVALCRALLFDAPLIVLDEPFKGLDEDTKAAAIALVHKHSEGRAVLVVTHDEEEARALEARVVKL